MKEQLKASVLEKCQNEWESYGDNYLGQMVWHTKQMGGFWEVRDKDSTITYRFWDALPSDNKVWPLAADILGIAQPAEPNEYQFGYGKAWKEGYDAAKAEMPRPSDALLMEAWKAGKRHSGFGEPVITEGLPAFHQWLATLPADPLKADRELVKEEFVERSQYGWFEQFIREGEVFSPEFFEALKRLAGMEVGNG